MLRLVLLLSLYGVSIQAQTPGNNVGATEPLLIVHADVPLYPAVAQAARLIGTVRIQVHVSNGVVANAEAESSAHAILVNAAITNVKTWQFSADANGSFQVTYVYELDKEEGDFPENPRVEMRLPVLVKITSRPVKRTTSHSK
jgi:TonB family protein